MYTLKITKKSLQNNLNLITILNKINSKYFKENLNSLIIIKGGVKKKKKKKIYTILRSPHVHKKSREHFDFNFYTETYYINSNLYILINFMILIKKLIPQNINLKFQLNKN